ncbi:MAG TPA: VOC family protein [Pseudonocardiaceae bacterium]|jgi:catechol 2,3-dioxygenase-like lactoylglutathione lyase family enzyme|nr:VOC family protein [Pseudonocardiaceae bacterium]
MSPTLSGVHHLKFPVRDLRLSATWYERVLGARRRPEFDHRDPSGRLFAVILSVPGVDVPVELRLAPKAAANTAGYDPITFAVADRVALDEWVRHLDEVGVEHSPVLRGFVGQLLVFPDPDGLVLRLYTAAAGVAELDEADADLDSPWISTEIMASH